MAKSLASSFVANSHKSFASSILKTPSLVGARNSSGNKVHFKLPSNLQVVFGDAKQYNDLICTMRNSETKDADLCQFLREVRRNIAMLNKSLFRFVETLLKMKWANRSDVCSMEYESFLIDLLSSHNYYTKKVLDELVKIFVSEECYETDNDGVLTEKAQQCCSNVHNVLGNLLRVIPMASQVLHESVRGNYPYIRRDPKEHKSYVSNILKISMYYPELQSELFHLVIERLILLDVSVPKTDDLINCPDEASELAVFELDGLSEDSVGNPIAHSLDVTLQCVFQYIHTSCHNISDSRAELVLDRAYHFYSNLILVFNQIILPTDTTQHVQFLLFYLCSFDKTLLKSFLDYLWDRASCVEENILIKQKAVAYLAGVVVRAKYVSVSVAQSILGKFAVWIHNYIASLDKGIVIPDLRRHPLFYAVCQAIFYLIAFRHSDLLHPKQNLEFVLKLNMMKIVSSQLNPLRVCRPEIIENFAQVASTYQLAYCEPIIERNNRNTLPIIHHSESGTVVDPCGEEEILRAYFPYDSFVLPRSKEFIAPLYREYEGILEPSQNLTKKCEDDNDFMTEQLSSSIPSMLNRLSVSESQEDDRTDLSMSFK